MANPKDYDKENMLAHFIADWAPMIKMHMAKIKNNVGPKVWGEIDEGKLRDAGIDGLMDAVDKWNPEIAERLGNKFSTYAHTRIKHLMGDHVRENHGVNPHIKQAYSKLQEAKKQEVTPPEAPKTPETQQQPATPKIPEEPEE